MNSKMQVAKSNYAKIIKKLKAKIALHRVNFKHKLKFTDNEIDFIIDSAFDDEKEI